ncbi:hypothetical protein AAEX28_09870 [Lentisphaerota bacterium WC36G]|nr:hypothetical protein LJT99_12705 [Lentisphaerae bacterium WC36]
MFGDNSGVDLKITEDNSYNFSIEVNMYRDGYIFLTLGLILIVTAYFGDPVTEISFSELLQKQWIFKAMGLLLIVFAFTKNFKKYNFNFSVVEKVCDINERKFFFLSKKYQVKFDEIEYIVEIINGEGPSRYQAVLYVNNCPFILGDSADSDEFEAYMLRLQDIGIKCSGV